MPSLRPARASRKSDVSDACPRCGAKAGAPCFSVGQDSYNRGAPLKRVHPERLRQASVESKPKPRVQCAKCPWKRGTDPNEIPGGYSVDKHRALKDTIAEPGSADGLSGPMKMMACHETTGGAEQPCVGWLAHQLGPGNNIALRLRVTMKQIDANFRLVGPQHKRFEDTLPRQPRRAQ